MVRPTSCPTDLQLLYELSEELSFHFQQVLLHLHQAGHLLKVGNAVVSDRVSPDGDVFLHGDYDNRALFEIVLFPSYWSRVLRKVESSLAEIQEFVESPLPDEYLLNEGEPTSDEFWATSVYPEIWNQVGLGVLRRLHQELPARRILAGYYGAGRAIERVYELYQTAAYPLLFHEEAAPEPPSGTGNGSPPEDPLLDSERSEESSADPTGWEPSEDSDPEHEDDQDGGDPFL